MANSETLVTGKKYRVLKDAQNNDWDRMSFWTHASDVEFDDNSSLEDKLDGFSGITSSVSSLTSSDKYAVSTNGLIGWVPFKLGIDANGNYGYYKAGADTVTPFSSLKLLWENTSPKAEFKNQTLNIDSSNYDCLIFQVFYIPSTNNTVQSFNILIKNKDYNYRIGAEYGGNYYREVTITDSAITIGACKVSSYQYKGAVPYRIYGANLGNLLSYVTL